MITSDLVRYIQSQIDKNKSKDLIVSKLTQAGWRDEDIREAFDSISSKIQNEIKISVEASDPYREKIDSDKSSEQFSSPGSYFEVEPSLDLEEETKATVIKEKELEPTEPKQFNIEIDRVELPVFEAPKVAVIEKETPKIWIPTTIKPKIEEIQDIKKEEIIIKPAETIENKIEPEIKPEVKLEESMKISSPAISPNYININKEVKIDNNNIAKSAMLSSFGKDLSTITKEDTSTKKSSFSKNIFNKTFIIILIILIILGGASFALAKRYIKIPSFNLSFIKKDPKVLLLKTAEELNKLDFYKTETSLKVSSPLVANITSGLVSGEAISSKDTDFIELKTDGLFTNRGSNQSFYNYDSIIRSSLLRDDINIDFKYDGITAFISTPKPALLLGSNAPSVNTIAVSNWQFDLLKSLAPSFIKNKLEKVDINKILLNGLSDDTKDNISTHFIKFIDNITVLEKENEIVKGVETYHYQINSDRQITKMFLNNLTRVFINSLSEEEKVRIDDIVGSSSIESFDIWVGKKDSNIYQYEIKLNIPLSKIIGFSDRGIADNVISIDWKKTYYDFNIPNNLSMPSDSVDIETFLKSIQDMRIKNNISLLKNSTNSMRNIMGNYGKNYNLSGSCSSPASGSLFSPLGHIKSASGAIGEIAQIMNSLLIETNNIGHCYSNPKAWAVAVPLSSDPNSLFCMDNTGESKILKTAPIGPTCNQVLN